MITIKLIYRAEGTDKTNGTIHVRFYVRRKKIQFTTKVQCKSKHWNVGTMRISSADKLAADKNLILDNTLSRINNVFVKYRLRNKELTKEGFEKAYNRPDDFENFFAFCDDYKRQVSKEVELVTLAIHSTVLQKLKEFSPELHFDEINKEFLDSFYRYLRKKLKNNENTAYKNMSIVRKYVKQAYRKGYMDENPFEDFHILRTKANYTYLDESELQRMIMLYQHVQLEDGYYKTLQLFLFMCLSSLHIGDAKQVQVEQFSNVALTYYRMKLRNKKPEPVVVPISSALRVMLNDIIGGKKKGLIFSELKADQTMNEYLKEMAAMVGIKKNISHKTGRHTFATFFLSKVPDLNTLRDIMGHSDVRQTLIYAHVLEKSKERGIACFDVFEI